ncbi:MAG: CHAT domain-containing tetratricopeptide repeat protein [Chryseolinea sp.]
MKALTAVLFFTALAIFSQAQQAVPSWKIYYDSAQLYWSKDWNKTVPLLARAEKSALYDLGIYDENYLTIINDLGLAYAKVGDYSNAEKLLGKCVSIKTELIKTPNADLYRTILNLATVHSEQGHIAEAEKYYKQVLAGLNPDSEPELYRKTITSLVALFESTGHPDQALSTLDILKISETGTSAEQLNTIYELQLARGRLNRKLGNFDASQKILDGVSTKIKNSQDKKFNDLFVECLVEHGLVDMEIGLFNQAEKNFLQAFRLVKDETPVDNAKLTEVLNNLGGVYEKLGIQEKALVYYQDALAICVHVYGSNSLYTLTLQSNISGIELRQGHIQKAVKGYEAAENKFKIAAPESSASYITVLNNLASAYRANKQIKEARQTLERAYGLVQKYHLANDDLAASIMNNMAVLLTATGNTQEAIGYYEKAYDLRKKIYGDNSVLLMDLASNMAVVYWELKKPEKSLPLFQKSIELAIRQIKYIFPNLSEDEQVQFYKKLKEDFERFNTIAFQNATKNPELLTQVFNNEITIKSLLFFTQRHRRQLVDAKNDTMLVRHYDQLKSKREQLGYFYQLSLKDIAQTKVTAIELEKEIESLEKSISLKTSETIAEKMMGDVIRWSDIQSKMQPDEALIEIIRFRKYDLKKLGEGIDARTSFGFTDSVYYAALITTQETKQTPQLVLLKEGTNMETRFLNYYRNALTYYVKDENSYPYYWKPFEPFINSKKTIYLSGDGVYHRLNLNTIADPVSNQFLINRYNIHYLLNPAQYVEKTKQTFYSKTATLIGDPVFDLVYLGESGQRAGEQFAALPGTNTEVVKINEILKEKGWTAQLYLRKLATEKNLKAVHSPAILHIATHGFFSTDKVKLSAEAKKDYLFYSGLVLSGANRNLADETQEIYDDGIVTAYEVMNLDLTHTHLVVLSACETGLGKLENGEGVYGLQRSFLQAGARNILISLWKVDDQITQELMVKFYQYLFQGKPEREALKLAQIDLMKKNSNPVGWGSFIVVGLD